MDSDTLYEFETPADMPAAGQGPPGTAADPFQVPATAVSHQALPSTAQQWNASISTAYQDRGAERPRPMTSVKAAGFRTAIPPGTAKNRGPGAAFDPLHMQAGPAPPLQKREDAGPEWQARSLELQVHNHLDKTATALAKGDDLAALEEARAAGKVERAVAKVREANNIMDSYNIDLKFSVVVNLALAYHANGMLQDALNTYNLVVKNKQFTQAPRMRLNMGAIYFEQRRYPTAIKLFRMALDQMPNAHMRTRSSKLPHLSVALQYAVQNERRTGIKAYCNPGQYREAADAFEESFAARPNSNTALHLIVCHFALGDRERMRRSFLDLVTMKQDDAFNDVDSDDPDGENDEAMDDISRARMARKLDFQQTLSTAARLIAPVVDSNFSRGFQFVVDALRGSRFNAVANELEIEKAITFIKNEDFETSVATLKDFENSKDETLVTMASTNLAFLFFLEGDIDSAEKYANIAIQADRYNAPGLVNKGNCMYRRGEVDACREFYLEAIGVDAECTEAIYNWGLVSKQLGSLEEALQAFHKLYSILPDHPLVLYQLGHTKELLGDLEGAQKWYSLVASAVPGDPRNLAKLGQMNAQGGDEAQAFHFYMESFRSLPSDMDVISWLGAYFVKNEMYEKAIQFFERAGQLRPAEVKWHLMVASCHRRTGDYHQAIRVYERVHERFPDNVESVKYLVQLCKELNMTQKAATYTQSLERLSVLVPTASSESGSGERRPGAVTEREEVAAKSQQDVEKTTEKEDMWADEELDENMLPGI